MQRLLLISTISTLLCSTASAQTIELRAPGRLTFQRDGSPALDVDLRLEVDRFCATRETIDYYRGLKSATVGYVEALKACTQRECEQARPPPEPWVTLPTVIGIGVAVLAAGVITGVVVGVEATRPREVSP